MDSASRELERHLERQMRSQERQLVVLRLAVAAIAALFLFAFRDRLETAEILLVLCAAVVVYDAVITLLIPRFPAREVGIVAIGLDIVTVTLAVHFSANALDSYLLYGLVILTVALRFGLAASVWSAIVVSFMYVAVTFSASADPRVRELIPVRVAYLMTIGVGTGVLSRVVLGRASENARLAQRLAGEERERAAAREREVLSQLQREFVESLDQRATAEAIARGASTLLGEVTWLCLAEGSNGPLRLAAVAGRDPVLAERLRRQLEEREIRFGEGVAGSAAATATPVLVRDAANEPRSTGDPDAMESTGWRSMVAVPVMTRGIVRGVLASASRSPLGEDQLRLAEAIAERAGPALENASLWVDLQRRMDREHEAQRIKDDFLSIVSHELRTPLTSIQGYSQLLEGRLLSDPSRYTKELGHLQVVRSQVSRMRRLVDDLLDVSRIDRRGGVSVEPARFDLAELVRDAVGRTRRQYGDRVIELRAPEALEVEADRDRIDQVVTNLLDNAVKYSPDGGPVGVLVVGDGREAQVSVSDSGIGIPAEHRHHVFERFYQADGDASRRRFGGLGLGLYISRAIVEAHGGSISAAANPAGRGTVFSFRIPVRSPAGLAGSLPAAGEPPPFVVRRHGG
ncbi:MAG TPA: GAF domain-containing sensor histidine kinase [Candidatus Limnocylindria bacterium]|nr:GAF domain-containing sensor histidine kinase [Candidatus Limnocylindria bacterium]